MRHLANILSLLLVSIFVSLLLSLTIGVVSSLLFIATARAEEAVLLEKTTPAPYTGILMPVEKVRELRKMAFDLEIEKLKTASFEQSIAIYKQNETLNAESLKLLREQNLKLGKTVAKRQGLTEFEILFSAGAGIMVTGNAPVGVLVAGAGVVVWIVKLIAGEVN